MNLDGRVMSVSATASRGVVDSNTLLCLRQQRDRIFGRYGGGSYS